MANFGPPTHPFLSTWLLNASLPIYLQNKKEKLEAILSENENVTLHANHYLLTGAREKLIQVVMAMRGLTSNETESLRLLKYQVDLFRKVHDVMTKVDLPRDFWDR